MGLTFGIIAFAHFRPTFFLAISPFPFYNGFTEQMKKGLAIFDRRIKDYAVSDAVLTAPETRTSSPVRILRGEDRQSISVEGIYPCGEGSGYAGGIMSSAVDGIHTAGAVIERFSPPGD